VEVSHSSHWSWLSPPPILYMVLWFFQFYVKTLLRYY
jgi:hypothetical protein